MALSSRDITQFGRNSVKKASEYLRSSESRLVSSARNTLADNRIYPTRLRSALSVSTYADSDRTGFEWRYDPLMAMLRTPPTFTRTRLIPTEAGMRSAPARLVYRLAYGIVGSAVQQAADQYHTDVIDAVQDEIDATFITSKK